MFCLKLYKATIILSKTITHLSIPWKISPNYSNEMFSTTYRSHIYEARWRWSFWFRYL